MIQPRQPEAQEHYAGRPFSSAIGSPLEGRTYDLLVPELPQTVHPLGEIDATVQWISSTWMHSSIAQRGFGIASSSILTEYLTDPREPRGAPNEACELIDPGPANEIEVNLGKQAVTASAAPLPHRFMRRGSDSLNSALLPLCRA